MRRLTGTTGGFVRMTIWGLGDGNEGFWREMPEMLGLASSQLRTARNTAQIRRSPTAEMCRLRHTKAFSAGRWRETPFTVCRETGREDRLFADDERFEGRAMPTTHRPSKIQALGGHSPSYE